MFDREIFFGAIHVKFDVSCVEKLILLPKIFNFGQAVSYSKTMHINALMQYGTESYSLLVLFQKKN